MKAIEPRFAFALSFAIAAIVATIAGQKLGNPYFIIAAAAFALATYVTHPPYWATELVKYLPGRRDNE
jgi:hypothetical protein